MCFGNSPHPVQPGLRVPEWVSETRTEPAPTVKSGWHENPEAPPARTDPLPRSVWTREDEPRRRDTAAAVLHAVVAFCSGAIVMGLILMPWVKP